MKKKILLGLFSFMFLSGAASAVTVDNTWSERFLNIAPNGVYEPNAVMPANEAEADYYSNTYILSKYGHYGNLYECNSDYSECELQIYSEDNSFAREVHVVEIKWKQEDPKVKEIINASMAGVEQDRNPDSGNVSYSADDLGVVNFFATLANNSNADIKVTDLNLKVAGYSTKLRKRFSGANITYVFDLRMGTMAPINGGGIGGMVLYYKGTAYGLIKDASSGYNSVIYVADDTELSTDALIAAAQKRIDDYFKNSGITVKVELGGTAQESIAAFGDDCIDYGTYDTAMGDMAKYFYYVKIGESKLPFLIVRDSSKIPSDMEVSTKDIHTNIIISTDNASVPLDTIINVNEVSKDSNEFKVIDNVLGVKDKNIQIYDLTLYSDTIEKNISKLNSGEFEVEVPLSDALKGKELVAYYVTADNKIEAHPVTQENGIGTFTTDHFSTYTITEKINISNTSNPNTIDNITYYIILGIVGIIGMGSLILSTKKKM